MRFHFKNEQLDKAAALSSVFEKPVKDTLFRRLQSTIILFLVMGVLCFILHTTWGIIQSISKSFHQFAESKNIKISRTSANIGVRYRSKASMVDDTQRFAHRALMSVISGAGTGNSSSMSRILKLKEWKDRKRTVYKGSGTEAANAGW